MLDLDIQKFRFFSGVALYDTSSARTAIAISSCHGLEQSYFHPAS
jgi:hypothetical protein